MPQRQARQVWARRGRGGQAGGTAGRACAVKVQGGQRGAARRGRRLQHSAVLRQRRAVARAQDRKPQQRAAASRTSGAHESLLLQLLLLLLLLLLRLLLLLLFLVVVVVVSLLLLLLLLCLQPLPRRQEARHRCALRKAQHAIPGPLIPQHPRQQLLRLPPPGSLRLELPLINIPGSQAGPRRC